MRNLWLVVGLCFAVFWAGVFWVLQTPETPEYSPATAAKNEIPADSDNISAEAKGRPVLLAVIAPLTGLSTGVEPVISAVVDFCAEKINSSGGILGRKVEVLHLDNHNTPLGSKRAAEEAVKARVSAVIGGRNSSDVMAMGVVLQEAGIPLVAASASNPQVTRLGDYIFRVHYTDSFQGAALARFAREDLGARTAALAVNVSNSYSPFLAEVFIEQFSQLGGQVVSRVDYVSETHDFGEVGAKIAKAAADLVFIPGYETDSALLVAAARRAGAASVFMGGDGWDKPMYRIAGQAVEGGYFAAAWHPRAEPYPGLAGELGQWIERRGDGNMDIEALTLDAAFLVFDAIRRAGTDEPGPVRDALAATDGFEGITGSYSFDRNGDPEKALVMVRLAGGSIDYVKTQSPERVPVAVIFAKTGNAAELNLSGFEAVRFAAEEINLRGGVLGRRIVLLEYDNESTSLGSRRAAEQAVADGAAAVIGASWSSHSEAMAVVLQQAGIPMITPISTHPGVTLDRDFVFRICFNDQQQADAMALFALRDLRAKTAAVLVNANNQYSADLADFFIRRFREDGLVVSKLDYLNETNDFRPILETLILLRPDVVFIPGYARDSAFIIRQARSMGLGSIFLGGDGWVENMYEYAPSEIEGSYFTGHWHVDNPDPRSRDFVVRYASGHKLYRQSLAALTYDSVFLLADAMRRAASTDPAAVRDALAATRDFIGVTGPVAFDSNGDPDKPVGILRFDRGRAGFEKSVHSRLPGRNRD